MPIGSAKDELVGFDGSICRLLAPMDPNAATQMTPRKQPNLRCRLLRSSRCKRFSIDSTWALFRLDSGVCMETSRLLADAMLRSLSRD